MRAEKCPKPIYEPKKNETTFAPPASYILNKYQELEKVLDQERVLAYSKSSVGRYEDARVVLEKKAGDWKRFGFVQNQVTYVPLHEALFLAESVSGSGSVQGISIILFSFQKRLLVFRNKVIMSLEECYKTFLAEDGPSREDNGKLTLAEYLVYAFMVRNQLNVRLYQDKSPEGKIPEVPEINEEELIWSHLDELLARRSGKGDTPLEKKIMQTMQESKVFIESQSSLGITLEETVFQWPKKTSKRKYSSDWQAPSKRHKAEREDRGLDKLKSDEEYQAMKDVFERLEVIKFNSFPMDGNFQSTFKFTFDFSQMGKKNKEVSYRGIVCTRGSIPNYKDLIYLQRQQREPLPIMVFNVDESMVVNCFLYQVGL